MSAVRIAGSRNDSYMERMLRLTIVSCLAWTLVPVSAHAAARCRPVTVPVLVRGTRPLVAVTLDDRPATMVLDTGAYSTILLPDAPARLGLDRDPTRPAEQGTSYGAPIQLTFARVGRIGFGGKISATDDLAVVSGGLSEPGIEGFFIDGRAQEAEYDIAHEHMRLACPPFHAPSWTRRRNVAYVKLDDRQRLFGTAFIHGRPVTVLFDTGSPGSSITLDAAIRVGVAVTGQPDGSATGLSKTPLRAWTTMVSDLQIGSEPPHLARLLIVDKPHASADMIAGFDFFATNRVWIDRQRRRLLFRAEKPSAR